MKLQASVRWVRTLLRIDFLVQRIRVKCPSLAKKESRSHALRWLHGCGQTVAPLSRSMSIRQRTSRSQKFHRACRGSVVYHQHHSRRTTGTRLTASARQNLCGLLLGGSTLEVHWTKAVGQPILTTKFKMADLVGGACRSTRFSAFLLTRD